MAFRITKSKVIIAVVLLIIAFIAISRAHKTPEPESVKTIPVVIETVTNSSMTQRLFINGEIKGLNQADIYPDVPGKVMELFVHEGQYVGAGQVVATIDRSQVGMIYMPATVTTPISGVVGKIYVERGRTVSPAVPIMFIADTRVVEGVLNIPEKDIGYYKLGQEAGIRVESQPDTVFKGYVSRIASVIDSLARTLEVRITLVNTGNMLIPGNYADFSIKVKELPDQVKVPYDAVIDTIERKEVYVVEEAESPLGSTTVKDDPKDKKTVSLGSGRHLVARERIITTGIRDGEWIQVLSGLTPGEKIISLGKENVVDGMPVREVPKKAMENLSNTAEPEPEPGTPANNAE